MIRSCVLRCPAVLLLLTGLPMIQPGACDDARGLNDAKHGKQGQWIQFRADRALTGRSLLPGKITTPKVLWKRFIGGRETLLEVKLGAAETASDVELPI